MSRLLLILVLILAGVLGFGIYMKWFHISADSAGGTHNITFSVDDKKIKDDEKRLEEKVHDLGSPSKGKAADPPQ